MRKEDKILITVLFLMLFIIPVSAFTGNFSRTDGVTTSGCNVITDGTPPSPTFIRDLRFNHIEDFQSLIGISSAKAYTSYVWDYSVQSYSTDVDAYIGTTKIGSGLFGFNNNTATGNIVIYFYPTSWENTFTGNQLVNFTSTSDYAYYTANGLRQLRDTDGTHCLIGGMCGFITPEYGWVAPDITTVFTGVYTVNNQFKFENFWSLTELGGSIHATVSKMLNGVPYKSKVYLYRNDSSSGVITSDLAMGFTKFDVYTIIKPVKIAVRDSNTNWYNTTYYYSTPSTLYHIVVSPTDITSNQSAMGEVTSSTDTSFTQITAINWQYYLTSPLVDLQSFYENGDNIHDLNYVLKSGVWYGWNANDMDFTNNKGATFPKQVVLYPQSSGNLTVLFTVYTLDGNMEMITAPLNVGASGLNTKVILEAADWQTGMLISPVNWSVKNMFNNVWQNKSITYGDGHLTVEYNTGTTLYVEANAYGYEKGTLVKQVPQGNDIWIIQLYPLSAVSTSLTNTTLLIKALGDNNDGKYQPLNNVGITLSDSQYQLTSTIGGVAGQAQFTVLNNSVYTITAEKDGYISQVHNRLVFGNIYTDAMYLSPLSGSTLIPTTAPTATATTPLGGAGIGGAVVNATTCQIGNQNLTFIGNLQNFIACQGITSKSNQNLALGGLIILFCGAMLGKYKPFGILIGASVGVAICFALDLLPFYIYVFIFIMFALVIASLINKKIGG